MPTAQPKNFTPGKPRGVTRAAGAPRDACKPRSRPLARALRLRTGSRAHSVVRLREHTTCNIRHTPVRLSERYLRLREWIGLGLWLRHQRRMAVPQTRAPAGLHAAFFRGRAGRQAVL